MTHPNSPLPGGESKPFNTEEHLALYKFKTITEIKEEIVSWAQVRLALLTTMLSMLILTGSFVGIKLLVEGHIERIAKAPVEQHIRVLQEAGQTARENVERFRLQSEQVSRMSFDAERDLQRLRREADNVSRVVTEIAPKIQSASNDLQRLEEGTRLSSQFLQEQALRTKADMLEMRNSVDLLHAGFGIIEKLAAEIRQKEPNSELARQFAGFSAQWREAREAYQRRAELIKLRRNIKIIHYIREDAPAARQQLSTRFVDALLLQGYTAEGWVAQSNDEVKAALEVADRFGLNTKSLMQPAVIISPDSPLDVDDLQQIATSLGIKLPPVVRVEFTPKMKEIVAGGEGGSTFAPRNIVLIAELTDGS